MFIKKIIMNFIIVISLFIFSSNVYAEGNGEDIDYDNTWVTISTKNLFWDYGSDLIDSNVELKKEDGNNKTRVMSTNSLGMKTIDSQSLFVKNYDVNYYRLITPNGWKVTEDIYSHNIFLKDDTGEFNQMWFIEICDEGISFKNYQTLRYICISGNNVTTSEQPFYFDLEERKYTGWDWYYDTDYGIYYLNGEALENVDNPFSKGKYGEIYTGLKWDNGEWNYYHLNVREPDYNGLVYCNSAWHYVKNGKLDREFKGLYYFNRAWYYISNGTINKEYTGLTYYNNNWWYIKSGKLDKDYKGLVYCNSAWWYIRNGQIDRNFTGLKYFNNNWWYIKNGKLDKDYKGLVYCNSVWWYVSNGQINRNYTGLTYYNNTWWYIENGIIDKSFKGLFKYNGNLWYVVNGAVDKSYNGTVTYQGKTVTVKDGWGGKV